ncbi:hypothetical protein Vadar_013371 [Vaccinium darrowii]|uniref:Uncharacterized protein n=1 Tax=Vaccinium darrowii TaxID=229202 RepID=A0ACB7ZCD7_9ERIC|nr:hypothetical protein Vadar_013371 [Vaccinium darrowii]
MRFSAFLYRYRVLVNFLQLQYQGKDFSPFETHPKTMGFAVASLFLYCLTHDAGLSLTSSHLKPAYYARVVHGGMALSGSLLAVSLASIIFHGPVWLPLYFLYIMFSSKQMMRYRLDMLWSWLRKKLMAGFHSGPHLPKRALLPI